MNTPVKKNGFWPSSSFFDDFLTRDLFDGPALTRSIINRSGRTTLPAVNILETDSDFRIEVAAPGLRKEDFHVELDHDQLTISSNVSESVESGSTYTCREFNYGSFRRTFHLPETVESEKIHGKYQDGILSLVIPKKDEARRKPAKTIRIS